MSGCEIYQIRILEKFEDTYNGIIRTHYSKRRQRRNKELFEEQVASYIDQLRQYPRLPKLDSPEGIAKAACNVESFPYGVSSNGLEFWKIRFEPIGSMGEARWGRLMYVICESWHTIFLMWMYTHYEFGRRESRPSDKDLKHQFNLINEEVQKLDKEESIS